MFVLQLPRRSSSHACELRNGVANDRQARTTVPMKLIYFIKDTRGGEVMIGVAAKGRLGQRI